MRVIKIFKWLLLFFPAIALVNYWGIFNVDYMPTDTSIYSPYTVSNMSSFKPSANPTVIDYGFNALAMLWEFVFQIINLILSVPTMFATLSNMYGIDPMLLTIIGVALTVSIIIAVVEIKAGRYVQE